MSICSRNKGRTGDGMANGGEMTTTGEGDVNPGDIWVPDAVAYRLAILTRSIWALLAERDDSYFEIVLSALKASNIASRAVSRLCFWRLDPEAGSYSLSPRFGMFGREVEGPSLRTEHKDKNGTTKNNWDTYGSFVQSRPPSSSSAEELPSSCPSLCPWPCNLETSALGSPRTSSIMR